MIVEAIRTDAYAGSLELENGKRSRYKCDHCPVTYEFVILAGEGEFAALSDSLPPHFDVLCDNIEKNHEHQHNTVTIQTDGVRCWSPERQPGRLTWER